MEPTTEHDTELTPQARADWKQRSWHFPLFEKLNARIRAFSPGDRLIFYSLAGLLGAASLLALYSLEQSLLVRVPAYGGSLIEGRVGSPRFINPLLAISDSDRDLASLTYAGLMGISGSGGLEPVLAERYEIGTDGKTYTFTLRADAAFTDGSPVTAADVVFTVHRAQDPALKSPEYANWSGVSAEALDARTVRFTLSKPYAPFMSLTTLGILPSRLWQNVSSDEFPFSYLETNPVGAGPFRVTRVMRDASGLISSITLAANEAYVLGRPYLDRVTFNFYPRSEDLAAALETGEIESAHDLPATGETSRTLTAPYARVFGVFWNPSENQVFARLEVRKALSLAIDRSALIEGVLDGYATAIIGPVPPGEKVTQAPLPVSTGPTQAAASVLESAGWKYDGSAREWKNAAAKQSLGSLTLRTSNVTELKNVAAAVKAEWEKLGVRVDIELYEPGDLSQNVIRPRRYEALLYGMVIGRDQDLYAFWSSQERNDPGLNIALYANKTVDTLLESSRTKVDKAARIADLQKIEDIVASEYPAAFLYAPNFLYTVPLGLEGVVLPQIVTPADRFATAAAWYRVTDMVWPFLAQNK